MLAFTLVTFIIASTSSDLVGAQPTTDEIRAISDEIWKSDVNRIEGSDVIYNVNGAKFFTYVNEARFTSTTYARFIDLLDNYIPEVGIPETCGAPCRAEEEAFLNAIITTRPIQLLHNFLFGKGLASPTLSDFKEEIRQYFFMPYTRSRGPLDSSGFEHTFVGEINNGAVSGFHNWVNMYFTEKSGDFQYGTYTRACPSETHAFQFRYYGYNKPISSMFIRTSPEVEIALYTLCLCTRIGTACPVQRNGVQQTMTAWDMTGLPKTIGSAYPNC
jgi:poly(U)-specific endoribonuclease